MCTVFLGIPFSSGCVCNSYEKEKALLSCFGSDAVISLNCFMWTVCTGEICISAYGCDAVVFLVRITGLTCFMSVFGVKYHCLIFVMNGGKDEFIRENSGR